MLYTILSKQAQVILNMGSLEEAGRLDVQLAKQAEYAGKVEACMEQKQAIYERFVLRELDAEGYKAQKGTIGSELNRLKRLHAPLPRRPRRHSLTRKHGVSGWSWQRRLVRLAV